MYWAIKADFWFDLGLRQEKKMLNTQLNRSREDNREKLMMHKWILVSGKWWILTYCRRNVSVGRVIGIHIGRVMGGREHSVVVDSDSWTKTTEIDIDSHLYWHITEENSERRTTGGTWCTGMRQSDAERKEDFPELRVTPHIILMSIPDPSATLNIYLETCINQSGDNIAAVSIQQNLTLTGMNQNYDNSLHFVRLSLPSHDQILHNKQHGAFKKAWWWLEGGWWQTARDHADRDV